MTYLMEPRQAQPPAREVDDMDSDDASPYDPMVLVSDNKLSERAFVLGQPQQTIDQRR